MADTVISVENVSKCYRLGVIGTGTFYGDLKRWWARQRGKPDPYQRIGEQDHGNRQGELLWALRDIDLQVQQGEVLGVIGRNGAGKSTLLKVLSEVTAPTSGEVKIKGRVASLLEVGTGFHPDLTGRENMYLNGAILGMSRQEVRRKFEEIVDFAGIERFIDTPVKRYSSGMYVRLAFAVAAHLESEILIIDEVLAVGDAEFQKKCLGKVGNVAKDGRTVLFVSHNMQAVQNLCSRSLVLVGGRKNFDGSTGEAIALYLKSATNAKNNVAWSTEEAPGNESVRLLKTWVKNLTQPGEDHLFTINDDLEIGVEFENRIPGESVLDITIHLQDERNILVFVTGSGRYSSQKLGPARYRATCRVPGALLNQGTFTINRLLFVKDHGHVVYEYPDALTFDVIMPAEGRFGWMGEKEGVVRPQLDWTKTKIE